MKENIAIKFYAMVISRIFRFGIARRYPGLVFYCLRISGRYRLLLLEDFMAVIEFSRACLDDFESDVDRSDYVRRLAGAVIGLSPRYYAVLGHLLNFICELNLPGAIGSPSWFVEKLAEKCEVTLLVKAINSSDMTAAKRHWCLHALMQRYNRNGAYLSSVRLYRGIIGKGAARPRIQYFYLLALIKLRSRAFSTEASKIDFSRFAISQAISLFCVTSVDNKLRTQIVSRLLNRDDKELLEKNVSILWITSFFLKPGVLELSKFKSVYVDSMSVADYLYSNIFDRGAVVIKDFLDRQKTTGRPVLIGPVERFLSFVCDKSASGEVNSNNVGAVSRRFFGKSIIISMGSEFQGKFFGRLLFRGAYTLEQLLKPSLPFDSPCDVRTETGGGVVITTSDKNIPEFLSFGSHSYNVITLSRRVDNANSIQISNLWKVVSKDDFSEIIDVCSKAIEYFIKSNSPLGEIQNGRFLSEVLGVALEDSFFPYLRDALAIDRFVQESGCKNIYLHSTESDFQRNLGFALFLRKRSDVRIYFTFHKAFWSSSQAKLLSGIGKSLNSLLISDLFKDFKGVAEYYGNDAGGVCSLYRCSIDRYRSVENGGRALVLAAINDPSYRAVATSAADALAKEFNTKLAYIGKNELVGESAYRKERLQGVLNSVDGGGYLYDHPIMLKRLEMSLVDCPVDVLKIINNSMYIEFLPPIVKLLLKRFPLDLLHLKDVLETLCEGGFDLIVTTPGRHPTFRGVLLFSNMNGLPSIDVQAFFTSDNPRYKYSLASRYLTISEDQKILYEACYKDRGLNATRFGSFTIDAGLVEANKFFEKFPLNNIFSGRRRRHIVFAAQHGLDDFNIDIIKGILNFVMKSGGGVVATLKVHPRSTVNVCNGYRAIIAAAGADKLANVVHKESIYKILPSCDVLVTQFSNVGLEAAALGIDVVTVNLTKQPLPIDMEELGIAVQANSIDELILSVNKLFNDMAFADDVKRRREAYFSVNHELRSCDAKSRFLAIAKDMISSFH